MIDDMGMTRTLTFLCGPPLISIPSHLTGHSIFELRFVAIQKVATVVAVHPQSPIWTEHLMVLVLHCCYTNKDSVNLSIWPSF